MQFTLYYRGKLKSNGRPADKHLLRQHFHKQLKELWTQLPLKHFTDLLDEPKEGNLPVLETNGQFTFAPLVSEKISLVAEIDITLLWPQRPGAIITSGGDIDNRLKTLLDALKVPSEPTALPKGVKPESDETPFFCLFQDDSLITRIHVETDRLLEPVSDASEVALFIRVQTRQLMAYMGTIGLS